MLIHIDSIDPSPDNVRRLAASLDDDEALQRSIASLGVLQPILVIRNGDRHRLIDGERRVRLARAAGLTEICAEFAPRFDEAWATAAAAAANMVRSEMHPVDRWRIMARLQTQGYTLAAASAALGLTERAGKRLDRLSHLHPDVVAHLERGDWPSDQQLAVIAGATPERQAKALAAKDARLPNGPGKGCMIWWRVADALQETRIPASRAIFPRDDRLDWQEDLFAEPGSGTEEYTTDVSGFLAAQKAAMAAKIAAPPKGATYQLATIDQYGRVKAPKGAEIEHGADPDKPKRGRVVLWSLCTEGLNIGTVTRTVMKLAPAKKAAKGAAEKPEPPAQAPATQAAPTAIDDDDLDGSIDDDNDDACDGDPTPVDAPPADSHIGISKKGLALIAARKTDALRRRLRHAPADTLTCGQAIAALVLLLTAPNVTISGVDDPAALKALRSRLVNPAGHLVAPPTIDIYDDILAVAAEALALCLPIVAPGDQREWRRADAGEVAEWIGHALAAGAHLDRFDDAEFLAEVSGEPLRQIAAENGHKPTGKVGDLRRQLVGHLPDWRPAAAQFGAPGPRARSEGA